MGVQVTALTDSSNLSTPILTSTSGSAPTPNVQFTPEQIDLLKKQPEILSLVAWINGEYEKCKSARMPFVRQWYLNMAFYDGRQWVEYMKAIRGTVNYGKLAMPPAPPYRVRSTTNRIKPIIRTEISKLTSNKPNATVVPASSEDEDLFAAQAGEQVWEAIYADKKLMRIFSRSMFWLTVCGTSFIKEWWDKDSEDGKGNRGDIKYAPVTPFHVFVPDLMEEEIENQDYVINAYTKSVTWCKAAYGQNFTPNCVSTNEIMQNAFATILTSESSKPDSVLVLEAWLKPGVHKLFPQGGVATIIDNRLVSIYADGMLYNHKEYPFIKFEHIPTGLFYGDSVIKDLVGPQREYNRTRSQVIESKNRMAKPQLMAPKGSVNAAKITSEPGIVIEYRPGMTPPQPLPLQPIPSYVLQELDRSIADMEDISSQHQVSKGGVPTGVTAATAISYLQERDDSVMATSYQSVEAGWEKIAKQTLSHVVQFWETPRIVQTTGVDGSFDSIALKGSSISSGTDIRMEAGSALPTSKAARQAFIMDAMSKGFIPPDKGMKIMEIGGVAKLYEELNMDERQAQRENLRMRSLEIQAIEQHLEEANASVNDPQGVDIQNGDSLAIAQNIVSVNSWDNHAYHIEIHNRFRKGQAFEMLPDPIKAQFEYHVQLHAQALMVASDQAAMSQMNAEAVGGPENNGGSGGPPGSNQFGPPGASSGELPSIGNNSPEIGPPPA